MIVKLTYFKESGKYYAEGQLNLEGLLRPMNETPMYEIWKLIEARRDVGKLPGLINTFNNQPHHSYIISVDVPDHPHNHPHLILPPR